MRAGWSVALNKSRPRLVSDQKAQVYPFTTHCSDRVGCTSSFVCLFNQYLLAQSELSCVFSLEARLFLHPLGSLWEEDSKALRVMCLLVLGLHLSPTPCPAVPVGRHVLTNVSWGQAVVRSLRDLRCDLLWETRLSFPKLGANYQRVWRWFGLLYPHSGTFHPGL